MQIYQLICQNRAACWAEGEVHAADRQAGAMVRGERERPHNDVFNPMPTPPFHTHFQRTPLLPHTALIARSPC